MIRFAGYRYIIILILALLSSWAVVIADTLSGKALFAALAFFATGFLFRSYFLFVFVALIPLSFYFHIGNRIPRLGTSRDVFARIKRQISTYLQQEQTPEMLAITAKTLDIRGESVHLLFKSTSSEIKSLCEHIVEHHDKTAVLTLFSVEDTPCVLVLGTDTPVRSLTIKTDMLRITGTASTPFDSLRAEAETIITSGRTSAATVTLIGDTVTVAGTLNTDALIIQGKQLFLTADFNTVSAEFTGDRIAMSGTLSDTETLALTADTITGSVHYSDVWTGTRHISFGPDTPRCTVQRPDHNGTVRLHSEEKQHNGQTQ